MNLWTKFKEWVNRPTKLEIAIEESREEIAVAHAWIKTLTDEELAAEVYRIFSDEKRKESIYDTAVINNAAGRFHLQHKEPEK